MSLPQSRKPKLSELCLVKFICSRSLLPFPNILGFVKNSLRDQIVAEGRINTYLSGRSVGESMKFIIAINAFFAH